jgi:hypothetical protein
VSLSRIFPWLFGGPSVRKIECLVLAKTRVRKTNRDEDNSCHPFSTYIKSIFVIYYDSIPSCTSYTIYSLHLNSSYPKVLHILTYTSPYPSYEPFNHTLGPIPPKRQIHKRQHRSDSACIQWSFVGVPATWFRDGTCGLWVRGLACVINGRSSGIRKGLKGLGYDMILW